MIKGILHPDDLYQKADRIGNDPIQQLALSLFEMRKIIFYKQPCEDDPRGYIDVYGTDPTKKILFDERYKYRFSMLAVWFDHISVQFSPVCSMTISPEADGLHINVFTHSAKGVEFELFDNTVIPISDFHAYAVETITEIRKRGISA